MGGHYGSGRQGLMAKYIALSLIWSESKKAYVHPGEEYECDDEIALILLEKGIIKPAEYKRRAKKGAKR